MVLRVGTIRDFFKPFSQPRDKAVPAQDGTTRVSASTRDEKNQLESRTSAEADPIISKAIHHVSISPPRKALASIEQKTPKAAVPVSSIESPLTPVPSHLSSPLALRTPSQKHYTRPDKDPVPSQTSFTSTGSRRMVINGVQAVTNTDSEPDLSSDDDLLDPDLIIPRKKRKLTPEPPTVSPIGSRQNAITIEDDSDTLVLGPKHRFSKKIRELPTTNYRHSLADIAKEFNQEQASETRRKDAEALVQSIQTAPVAPTSIIDAAVDLASDEDDRERIKSALARMDVTVESDVFYFFHGSGTATPPSWPIQSGIWSLLNDETDRKEAFSSGMVAEMAKHVSLPQSVLVYLSQALLQEQNETNCMAYLQVLRAISKKDLAFMHSSCSLASFYQGYTCLDKASLDTASLPSSIKSALCMIQLLATSIISVQQLSTAIFELILLNIDQHVQHDISLRFLIARTLGTLFESKVAKDAVPAIIDDMLGQNILTATQCCRAINAIDPSSTAVHLFRRQLAIHYILGVEADELVDLNSADTGTRLLVKLKNDRSFSAGDDTDWLLFHERMQVVDIAIDAGFASFTFLGDSTSTQPGKKSSAETEFNKQIDAITKQLQTVMNRIKDSGTGHLRRTEAKHALDGTVGRLRHCVRTKPAASTGVFTGASEQTMDDFWS